MHGYFEKGNGAGGGGAKSRGAGRRRGGETKQCRVWELRDVQGLRLDRLTGQMPSVLNEEGRAGPITAAATSTPRPFPSRGSTP